MLKEKFTTISTSVKVLLVIPSKFLGPSLWPTSPQTRKVLWPKPSPILCAPTYLVVTKCLTYLLPTYIVTSCIPYDVYWVIFMEYQFAWVFCRVDFLDFVILHLVCQVHFCQNTKWTSYFWNSGEIENSPKKKRSK